MSSGGQEHYSLVPRWKEEAATLESFEQRVKPFVSSTKREERYLCRPRLLSTFDSKGYTFRHVRDNLTDVQLEAADGSGAQQSVETIRLLLVHQQKKLSGCCWISSDSILFDEIMVKACGTGYVDSHCNTRKMAKH